MNGPFGQEFQPPTYKGSKRTCGRCGGARNEHIFGRICDLFLVEDRVKNDGSGRTITVEASDENIVRNSVTKRRWVRRSLLPEEVR